MPEFHLASCLSLSCLSVNESNKFELLSNDMSIFKAEFRGEIASLKEMITNLASTKVFDQQATAVPSTSHMQTAECESAQTPLYSEILELFQ